MLLSIQMAVVLWAAWAVALPNPEEMRFQRLLTDENSADQTTLGVLQDIVQDRDGFMWFATENGLVRYDSQEYRFYYADPDDPYSLSSSFVTTLLVDHAGILWLGTSQGLNRYNPLQDNFTVYRYNEGDAQALSGPFINALAEDDQHNIYIATVSGLSVLGPERDKFRNYYYTPGHTAPPGSNLHVGPSARELRSIYVDSQQRIWIGTTGSGLNQFHPQEQGFSHWPIKVRRPAPTGVDSIEYIAEDNHGELWLATHGGGLLRLNPEDGQFRHYLHHPRNPYSLGSNTLRSILLDRENRLWIATDHGGLALYDPERDWFYHARHSAYNNHSLSSDQLRTLYEDHQGNLWVGNFPGGVNFYDRAKSAFTTLTHQPDNPNSLIHDGVLAIFEDREGVIWFGTEGGLSAYHRRSGRFRHFQHDPDDPHSLRFNTIPAITEDHEGNLWVGAWSGGLHRLDRSTDQFVSYMPDPDNPYSLASEFVWQLAVDQNNQLWVANTEGAGLNHFDPETERFTRYAHDPTNTNSLSYDQVRALVIDHENKIWAGTPHGLDYFDPATGEFTRIRHDPESPKSISGNNITAVMQDRHQRIWAATDNGHVNVLSADREQFTHINRTQGLPRARVSSMVEDHMGQIWMGTSNGIAQVDPESLTVRMYTTSDGLAGNDHNRNAALQDSEGYLYFGSTRGVSMFHPERLPEDSPPPKVVITGLRLANQRVTPRSHPEVLQQAIEKTQQIRLNHRHTTLALDFSALSFRSSHRNRYAYKLEGFDNRWNEVGNNRTATYTNLNPGRYLFQVRAANSQGQWSTEPAELSVIVTPPPWRTFWAYGFYGLVGAALISLIIHLKSKRLQLEKERAVNARLLNLDRIKDTFLANTSHELRTPLNGIIGLAEASLDGTTGPINPNTAHNLALIVASGRRLSSLINDILDHSKLTDNTLELTPKPVDLHHAVTQVFSLLRPLADEKHIQLHNRVAPKMRAVWADPNRLQQILINLVGNGIKHAHAGQLAVSCVLTDNEVRVTVADSGVGIAPEDLDAVFLPFKQLESDDIRTQGGTGLGLAITKQLVELHRGRIWLESRPGEGSRFHFTIPSSNQPAAPLDAPPVKANSSNTGESRLGQLTPITQQVPEKLPPLPNAEHYRILIVDDDPVNRLVLSSMLGLHNYQVVEASNGEQALAKMKDGERIDLVLLDIMMPNLSGYEVCRRLRQDYPLAELPIIFLTAKRADQELLRVYTVGGNELLSKPVEKFELLAKVRTYIQLLQAYRDQR